MNQAMQDMNLSTLWVLLPELTLVFFGVLLLLFGVYRRPQASAETVVSGVVALAATAVVLAMVAAAPPMLAMNGLFIHDGFAIFVKFLLLGAAALALMLASGWVAGRPFEYVVLVLFSVFGMMLMVSANDLISLYMGLEAASLALYVLASFDRDHPKSAESGLKYFILGALASGMMLFGMSLVYGFSGTTSFEQLASLLAASNGAVTKGLMLGMVLMIVGFCFKLSAVPFHMWAPDVYEGAPTPVTAFFATAPKIAAAALFGRVLLQPFGDLTDAWQPIVMFVSMASMLGGALGAMRQTNIKRLLAYSSISHAGFVLMGLCAASVSGVQAMLVYLSLYVLMSAGAFGCVLMMRRRGEAVEAISDLSGLSQTRPGMALALAICLFSMAGIPPLAGFFGKFYVILAAFEGGLYMLAVVGVIASVVGCYYYLRVVKVMYFDTPAAAFDSHHAWMLRAATLCGVAVTAFFFLLPTPLISTARAAASILFK